MNPTSQQEVEADTSSVSPRCPAGRSCPGEEPRKLPSAVWTLGPASLPVPSTGTPPPLPWSTRRSPGPTWQPDPGSPSSAGPGGTRGNLS